MSKKPKNSSKQSASISQADLDAFHQAVAGTKPLKASKPKITPAAPNRKIKPRSSDTTEPFLLNEITDVDTVGSEAIISYKQGSIPNKILRKLRKGQYNVDAILDLHGMNIEEARDAVSHFLQQCLHEGLRVVLIIHGKGHHSHMPILKNKLNHWLRELNLVLAFCSATPSDGSRGAVYVLLKKMTEENDS